MVKKIRAIILGFTVFYFTGCAKTTYKDTFIISNTFLEIQSNSKEAADLVYQEISRLDKKFNFYNPASEISKLNNSYNSSFKVSDEMFEILKLAKQINIETDGAFDVSYGALYSFWKEIIKKGTKQLPDDETIKRLKDLGGMQNIVIDEDQRTVTIKKEGLKIDLSGIAVGYMVDKAVGKLKEKGISSALINFGGDIYCLGKNNNRAWRVGIRNPKNNSIIKNIKLTDKAITTSGNYQQFFEIEGKRFSHLINPRTGLPEVSNLVSVTVIAEDCITADSLATAFFVMGLEGIKKFILKNKNLAVFVILEENHKQKILSFNE
ncbi:MAG: FAD:protein FMN transferase [Candidatus Omnitrophica bacterium]|nr:FAD:protein FMN transferase [Candidatus Omnitrophota bacterium]